ncbi:MAG TPA: hypothetical protein VGM92_12100 [Candidatus Kapabacteria bacterium]|jgi:hypothetical protein
MNEVIEKFREVLTRVARERGSWTFAGLIEREEAPYKLDIVLAGSWISNEREFLDYFIDKMKQIFSDAEFIRFARIVILNPQGEFLQEFNRIIGPLSKDTDVTNIRIADANVRWGHLFATRSLPEFMAVA